jgi:hypothetical protein
MLRPNPGRRRPELVPTIGFQHHFPEASLVDKLGGQHCGGAVMVSNKLLQNRSCQSGSKRKNYWVDLIQLQ